MTIRPIPIALVYTICMVFMFQAHFKDLLDNTLWGMLWGTLAYIICRIFKFIQLK